MGEKEIRATVAALMEAVEKLTEKVEACNGFCEQILDEVVPLGLAIDTIAAEAPTTAD